MFLMVVRKMLNNRWMVLCLLIGITIAVAMVSTIPMYTDGVLQRMLIKDLENTQTVTGEYPGTVHVNVNIYNRYAEGKRMQGFEKMEKTITGEMVPAMGIDAAQQTTVYWVDYCTGLPTEQRTAQNKSVYFKFNGIPGYEDQVKLVQGRMPSDKPNENGAIEVVAFLNTVNDRKVQLDVEYTLTSNRYQLDEPLKAVIVGIVEMAPGSELFWYDGEDTVVQGFMMDPDLMMEKFGQPDNMMISSVQWNYALDYHTITLNNLDRLTNGIQNMKRTLGRDNNGLEFSIPAADTLSTYADRADQLTTTLLVLQVPIMIMLAFYIFMVSSLIIEYEKNEIAVLRSRGAAGGQVFSTYLIEGLLVAAMALVIGPPIGLMLCRVIGASNGFLEFVSRSALSLQLTAKAYLYALYAAVFSVMTMLIPALMACRVTIVEHKRQKSERKKQPFWKKYFLDLVLLAVSLYGLYSYHNRQDLLAASENASNAAMDPLLFLISTLFILGLGLLILRIYPYILQLVFYLGRKIWSPIAYASFIQVSRSNGQEQFLMIFLILTLATGLFSANAARTINTNQEEALRYSYGADLVAQAEWDVIYARDDKGEIAAANYTEPDFSAYEKIDGVEAATRVLIDDNISVALGDARTGNSQVIRMGQNKVSLMAVEPYPFSQIAWFRDDLLSSHWYHYINALTQYPGGALLSSAAAQIEELDLQPGDQISFKTAEGSWQAVTILGFVDYWPGIDPHETPFFMIINYDYVKTYMEITPYEVWMKRTPDASTEQIYSSIEEQGLEFTSLRDAEQDLITIKNDPMLQGTNGALTLGFIVTLLVSAIGFLIYWIISIKSRVLMFGIFRAMGLSKRRVIGLLLMEQVLISGVAILLGIVVGGITSELFVPMLQTVYSSALQVPPFRVVMQAGDYLKIYIIMLIMMVSGFAVLGTLVSRIKIAQAIKLGED